VYTKTIDINEVLENISSGEGAFVAYGYLLNQLLPGNVGKWVLDHMMIAGMINHVNGIVRVGGDQIEDMHPLIPVLPRLTLARVSWSPNSDNTQGPGPIRVEFGERGFLATRVGLLFGEREQMLAQPVELGVLSQITFSTIHGFGTQNAPSDIVEILSDGLIFEIPVLVSIRLKQIIRLVYSRTDMVDQIYYRFQELVTP